MLYNNAMRHPNYAHQACASKLEISIVCECVCCCTMIFIVWVSAHWVCFCFGTPGWSEAATLTRERMGFCANVDYCMLTHLHIRSRPRTRTRTKPKPPFPGPNAFTSQHLRPLYIHALIVLMPPLRWRQRRRRRRRLRCGHCEEMCVFGGWRCWRWWWWQWEWVDCGVINTSASNIIPLRAHAGTHGINKWLCLRSGFAWPGRHEHVYAHVRAGACASLLGQTNAIDAAAQQQQQQHHQHISPELWSRARDKQTCQHLCRFVLMLL